MLYIQLRVVLAALAASMMLMTFLTGLTGFTRLLGLGHIFWVPLLFFLWTHLGQIPANDFYGIWIRLLMVINATSLVIDAVDVFRYLAGERGEIVKAI